MQFGMKYFRSLTIPEYEYYETKAENKDGTVVAFAQIGDNIRQSPGLKVL